MKTYCGTVRSFLNETPIENRDVETIYELNSHGHKNLYKFINGVDDCCFKRYHKKERSALFDLTDLSDLSDKFKKQVMVIRSMKENCNQANMIELFKQTNAELTIPEILVGYFRMFKKELTKGHLQQILYFLVKQRKIERVSRGLYKRVK